MELVISTKDRDHKFLLIGMGPPLIEKEHRAPPINPWLKQNNVESNNKAYGKTITVTTDQMNHLTIRCLLDGKSSRILAASAPK